MFHASKIHRNVLKLDHKNLYYNNTFPIDFAQNKIQSKKCNYNLFFSGIPSYRHEDPCLKSGQIGVLVTKDTQGSEMYAKTIFKFFSATKFSF